MPEFDLCQQTRDFQKRVNKRNKDAEGEEFITKYKKTNVENWYNFLRDNWVSSKEGLKVRTGDVLITNGSKQCWWNKKVGYFRKEDDGTVFPDGCMPVGHVFEFEYFCPVRRRVIC
jgi:hypothetical protein